MSNRVGASGKVGTTDLEGVIARALYKALEGTAHNPKA